MQSLTPDPTQYGLPSSKELEGYQIWDSYFTPSSGANSQKVVQEIARTMPTMDKGCIQKACLFLDVGLGTADAATEARIRSNPESILAPLQRWPERLLGMIQLNANDVVGSLEALNRWLRDGPMVGVYFPGGRRGALPCSHPNFDPLVERIAELDGLIMQHTWFKTGGKESDGESTPSELAQLARRFPSVSFICAHAGGEWERGLRAVRSCPNVLVETSGFDPTAGFLEMAVREVGAERIVFGSHLPSRSLGTELGKVVGAQVSEQDRHQVLGGNLRRLLAPVLRRKGVRVDSAGGSR